MRAEPPFDRYRRTLLQEFSSAAGTPGLTRTSMARAQVHKASGWAMVAFAAVSSARGDQLQFLPEFDANFKLNSVIRFNFQAKGDREGGDPLQFQIGPTIQFYVKPLVRLKEVAAFDLNDAKSRFLVLETGFRAVIAPNAQTIDRMIVAATSNFPMRGSFLVSDRNRTDLDWQTGRPFAWRYRNRFTVERTVSVSSYHFIPYVSAEPYYESQYGKWSTTALYAGSLFPVGKHVQFDAYVEHQNNTGKPPNKQDKEVGLALHLYFVRTQ